MTTAAEITKIEQEVKNAKKTADLGAALDRLRNNRDFRKIILEGYLETEAVRLVHAKGNPECQRPEKQATIARDIDGIASFVQYLNTICQLADLADKDIKDSELQLDELRKEIE
jgi:hypothetical protein